jgi:predicted transcriptional regulator
MKHNNKSQGVNPPQFNSSSYPQYKSEHYLRVFLEIVYNSLAPGDKRILKHLYECPLKKDYVSNIQKSIDVPYMTVMRRLKRMCDHGLISEIEERFNFYRYYMLTYHGIFLIQNTKMNRNIDYIKDRDGNQI